MGRSCQSLLAPVFLAPEGVDSAPLADCSIYRYLFYYLHDFVHIVSCSAFSFVCVCMQ